MAKFKADFFGAANGEIYPRVYPAGEECPPELETAAIEAGALDKKDVAKLIAAKAQAEADAAAKAQEEADAAAKAQEEAAKQ